ncbi:MAG: hypothetical protein UT24_C0024G0005 [Candidatus Woesebacteria bacterium GW2011_GWB1_39_12]|uniref:Uncharacterized protein n=1 Tax=Candidatus Woesebacteria bacterium GW2011_GWB1_39_12 TaxID=1618574 RepID=A0A0G0MG66_9BACT|nr:MAG: hypothetical protein UT24_C0024G0005 [Candidatus Woesebacteria bacterium GW2011_GWB1_39_12]
MPEQIESYKANHVEYHHVYDRELISSDNKKRPKYITPEMTSVIFTQGNKGSGKSSLDEFIAMENFEAGHTVVDLLSADNYESLFYMINLNCKKYWEEKAKDPNNVIPKYHCNCDKRYKLLVLVPDYVQIDQKALDAPTLNHKYYSKKEWKDAHPDSLEMPTVLHCKKCDIISVGDNTDIGCLICGCKERVRTPPIHPGYKEWIKVKHITIPNKGFKNRDLFIQQLTDALITGRDERRIVSINGIFNKNRIHKYRLTEQILREIKQIILSNFIPHDEYSVAKKRGSDKPIPKSEWSEEELNYHRITLLLREFGSVAPAGLKGVNEETLVKKALLDTIRLVRHAYITIIADFQRHADVIPAIRDQKDFFIFKQTNQDMFPMEGYGWVWNEVKIQHDTVARETNPALADRVCPMIEDFKPSQMLVLYKDKLPNGRRWKIERAGRPKFHHKQENDNFEKITGLEFGNTWRFVTEDENGQTVQTVKNEINEDKKVSESRQQSLYELVSKMKNPIDPTKKKMSYGEIYDHCKTLNLIPESWKGVDNLRKFMSDFNKKFNKPPTQTA